MPAKKTLPENALTTAKTISAKTTSREKTPTTTITTAKKKDLHDHVKRRNCLARGKSD